MKYNTLFYICALNSIVLAQVYDESQRPEICARNEQTCSTVCANIGSSDTVNTCDPDTFQFSCICDNKYTVSQTNMTFPASFAACQIQGTKCMADCGDDNSCAQACVKKYVCNVDDSTTPQSKRNSTSSSNTASSSKEPSVFDSNSNGYILKVNIVSSLVLAGMGIAAFY